MGLFRKDKKESPPSPQPDAAPEQAAAADVPPSERHKGLIARFKQGLKKTYQDMKW